VLVDAGSYTQDIVFDVEKYPLQAAKIIQEAGIIFTLLKNFFTACSVAFKRLLIFFQANCHITVNGIFELYLISFSTPLSRFFYNLQPMIIEKEKFFRGDAYLPELRKHRIDGIVLAGFLWKIPTALIKAYPHKIINIHPAILPKYGGKGMYGHFVHEAVIAAKEKESGITIHYVDEVYDHGAIIFQEHCTIETADTPESLAKKIQRLEHLHFPRVVEEWAQLQNRR
jgi:phosphoribosylglycinamide formyltransferase-1